MSKKIFAISIAILLLVSILPFIITACCFNLIKTNETTTVITEEVITFSENASKKLNNLEKQYSNEFVDELKSSKNINIIEDLLLDDDAVIKCKMV